MIKFKKNKKIFFGIVSCALVSLASVGFSSWIISIEQPNQNFSVSINVDTMSFETVICEAKLNKEKATITLGPTKVDDSGIVGGDKKEADLTTPITGQVIIANEEMDNIKGVKVSVASYSSSDQITDNSSDQITDSSSDQITDNNKVTIGTNDVFGRQAGDYYYLKPSIEIIAKTNLSFSGYTVSGFQVAELTALNDLSMAYSTFFGNEDPATFYSEKLNAIRENYIKKANGVTAETYLSAIKTAQTEIGNMKTALSSLTIKIEVLRNQEQINEKV